MSTRRARWVALGVLVAAAGAVVVILARPERSAAPAPIPMKAQAILYRTDQAVGGRFQLKLTNLGDQTFEVLGARLESAGFEVLPFTTDPVRYSPGERTDIVTPYGAARCEPDQPPEPAFARIRVRVEGEDERLLRLPLESIGDAIPRLHTRECQVAQVEAALDVALAPSRSPVMRDGRPVLEVDVVIHRLQGAEPIVVGDIRGSVLYRIELAASSDLPVRLAPGDDDASFPVIISAARCDGHALGDSSQPYAFPIRIRIGDDDIGYDIPVPDDQQRQLYEYLTAACEIVN